MTECRPTGPRTRLLQFFDSGNIDIDYKRLLACGYRLQTTAVFLRPIPIDYEICRCPGFDYKRLSTCRYRLQTTAVFLRPITIDFKIRIFSGFDYKRLLAFRFRLQTTTGSAISVSLDYPVCDIDSRK